MPETLHTCPRCGRTGYYAAGLRAHVCHGCKPGDERRRLTPEELRDATEAATPFLPMPNPGTTPTTGAAAHRKGAGEGMRETPFHPSPITLQSMSDHTTLVPATTISEADQRKLGAALTEQYHRAQCAQLEIIAFGAMCMELEGFIGTCADKPKSPKGGRPTGGLAAWLRQYAPDVEYTRARRYRDIAEALVGRLKLAGAEQLKQLTLADTEAAPLEGKMARKRDELIELVTDKSVRALQMELDLSDPIPQRGGPREKKPASDEPAAPAKAPDWCSDPEKELWGTLTDDQQRAAFQVFRPWIHEFHEQLTDGKRTLLPHLDERTRQDLVSTAEDLLRNLEPGLLRRS